MNEQIFREYDIRGIYPSEINGDVARTFGQSFASYVSDKTVLVGHDNRLSSEIIHQMLLKGLTECGANVIDLGLCSTPMYHVYKKNKHIKNGIMVTASHNPKEYNGFKISTDYYGNAYGKMIEDLKNFTLKGNFTFKNGSVIKDSPKEIYLNTIKNGINLGNKKLKVIYDMGNGTPSIIVKDVLDMFDIDYEIINGQSDGNFPSHHPDPFEKENMIQLQSKVLESHADIGIGIDGDGDRVGIVDDKGNIVAMDDIMILIYKYILPTMKNKKAIVGIKCSKKVKDELEKLNLPVEYFKISSYLNYKINTEDYDFGGELSGHIWFNDKYPAVDDGIYSGLRIIEMLSNTDKKLSQMIEELPKYYTSPEIKLEVSEDKKEKVIEKLKEILNKKNIKYITTDGVRINYDDGFALIRKSNTSPNITFRFEKANKEDLEKLQNEFIDLTKKIISELK